MQWRGGRLGGEESGQQQADDADKIVLLVRSKGSRNNNFPFWNVDPSRLAGRFMFLTEPAFPTSLWVTLRKLER
jgi:hypothetical protein